MFELARSLAPLLLCAAGSVAQADSHAELMNLRDAIAPGGCPLSGTIESVPVQIGIVHILPCRTTFADEVNVVIHERDGALHPLFFPLPDEGPAKTLTVTPFVTGAYTAEGASWIRSGHRIPPGLGDGHVTYFYGLTEYGPALERVSQEVDDGVVTQLWPEPEPRRADLSLPEPAHDLEGFTPLDVPALAAANPLDLLSRVGMLFPAHPEEDGRPELTIRMTQREDRIAVQMEETGWADDSVDGRAWRLLFELRGELWHLTGVGQTWICARGGSAGRCS